MKYEFKVGDIVTNDYNVVYTVTSMGHTVIRLDSGMTVNFDDNTLVPVVEQFDHLIFVAGSYIRLSDIKLVEKELFRDNYYVTIVYGSHIKTVKMDSASKVKHVHSAIIDIWRKYLTKGMPHEISTLTASTSNH